MSDQEDWKGRYLKEARDWESKEQLLRKVVTRLAIAAEGVSAPLDAVLGRIQEHVREGEQRALERDLNDLSRQIRKLDMQDPAPATSAVEPSPEPAVNTGSAQTCELLLTLIDEMSVTQPGVGAFATLREALHSGQDKDWQRVLERVIKEIRGLIQRISSDKHALEQLMREVGAELGGINEVLGEERGELQAGRAQAQEMQDIMHAGVERIESHMELESDIEKLKIGVSQSLEGIRKGIAQFIEKDSARISAAESRNARLRERIEKMEAETEQLQQQLTRNREKLMRDTLTGVRSRLAYDETLAEEFSRYRRYQETFCLCMLDIDFFKRVNDSFGHAAGDKALKLVASMISERVRDTDYLFRVGGEEFVLLLPRTELAVATPLLESVRQAVGNSGSHYESKPVQITLSAGVTAVRANDTAETLYERADDAMYTAKKAGRNQLVTLQ